MNDGFFCFVSKCHLLEEVITKNDFILENIKTSMLEGYQTVF